MAIPRYRLVNPSAPGFYHVISRCVRRAWLCGSDEVSGRSFEHRREWIRSRLLWLSRVFAVDVYAYAVMSNHYHIVLYRDPARVATWSAEDIAKRWLWLCPPKVLKEAADLESHPEFDKCVQEIVGNAERLACVRARLSDLSWFMRFLNEGIARRANAEDGVTGRFWEGRYRSQVLLDEGAVLACMAYVDLNPMRAGIADCLEDSDYTSVQERLEDARPLGSVDSQDPVRPLSGSVYQAESGVTRLSVSVEQYIGLVEWAAGVTRAKLRSRMGSPKDLLVPLERLGLRPRAWPLSVVEFGRRFRLVVGSSGALMSMAQKWGQGRLQGLSGARFMYLSENS